MYNSTELEKVVEEGTMMIITVPDDVCEQKDENYGRTPSLYPENLLLKQRRSHFVTIPQSKQDFNLLNNILQTISKTIKYSLISREAHKDGNPHYHICLSFTQPISIKQIHNKLLSIDGNIGGSINYQEVKHISKVINYIKKYGDYKETGEAPKSANLKPSNMDELNNDLSSIYQTDIPDEDALLIIKQKQPAYYTQYVDKIKKVLDEKKEIPKWEYEKYTSDNTILRPYQQKLWDIIETRPKPRQIIWVEGKPNTGKSFMFNYINENYKYRLYSAGQSASLDNVIYGYDEEGVIAWDIPKAFNFTELGDALATTIEKFSDFGQILTSKKYNGKKVRCLGHVLVFSNSPPLHQLAHRDIIHITTDDKSISGEDKQLQKLQIKKIIRNDGKPIWEQKCPNNVTKYYYSQADIDILLDNESVVDDD